MKKHLIVSICLLFICFFSYSQSLWKEETVSASRSKDTLPGNARFYSLNAAALRTRMQAVKPFDASLSSTAELQLPLADGSFITADVYESSILSPALQALIPDVKTYMLVDKATKNRLGRITVTANAITGLIFTDKGSVYINPVNESTDKTHIVYYTKDVHVPEAVGCGVKADPMAPAASINNARVTAGDCQLRTYRLAVAATGEYVAWAGSQANALTHITFCINTVNAIYERDATVHFTLVSNNSIIFTDAATDPYATESFPSGTTLTTNDNTLDANLGAANYDVGMVFNRGWNGGLAQLSAVCTTSKGRAAAGLTFGTGSNPTAGPQGPVFDGAVAHELGHTFSATHTMIANNGSCNGNVSAASAWEPGGGSTLMAYAGSCTGNSYQNNSDLYFHVGSAAQISNYITTGTGNSCPVVTPLSNVAPAVTVAATTYTIPVSTPFFLTCAATDANANNLTYTWEQLDAAAPITTPPTATATSGPNFRSFPATTNPTRYFPNFSAVLAGTTPVYEVLPSVSRAMHFTVNVRDNAANGGCNAQQSVTVNTNASSGGPFTVTSQNMPVSYTGNGSSTFTVTWNVAGTSGAPFNTANVDILFSADGGSNFNYTLVSATPNDGTETITIPNIPTSAGRIMVKAVGNIFYNVNTANITITSACVAEGARLSPAATVTAAPGNELLNLASAPNFGTTFLPTSGASLAATDSASTLAVFSSASGSCATFSNQYRYDAYPFQVSVAGTYTFTRTSGTYVMNLYSGSFTPGSPCTNFLASSGTYNGTSVSTALTVSASLIPGVQYILTVGTFSATVPALPFNYTISLTPPSGGNAFTGYPNPGASFSYGYVIVNNTSGNIVAISNKPDLRNTAVFPEGNYTVYGLSYSTANFPAATLNAYVGGPMTALTNDLQNNPGTRCGNLSKNNVLVNILIIRPANLRPLTAVDEGTRVKLYWGTESETGTKNFEIEKSTDGKNFVTIHTLPAAGTSISRINYTDYDETPSAGSNSYRVKAINYDSSFKYTNIAIVKKLNQGLALNTYPNPVKDKLVMELIAEASGSGTIEVVNTNGSMVGQKKLSWKIGMNIETLDMQFLSSGVYYIKLISETGIITIKAVKM